MRLRSALAPVIVAAMALVASALAAIAVAAPAAASGYAVVEQGQAILGNNASSVSVSLPSPTTAGDLLVAFGAVYPSSGTASAPAGFTLAGHTLGASGHSAGYQWYKVASGGTSSYTFDQTLGSSNYSVFSVTEFSGAPASVAVDGSVAWNTFSSVSGYTQTYATSPASSGELTFAWFVSSNATSATASSGWSPIAGPANNNDNAGDYFSIAGSSPPSISISSLSSSQSYVLAGMIAFRAAPAVVEQTGSSILTSGTSVTETFSSPTTAGDLLVAYATVYPYSSPVSAPPGFTAVGAAAGPSSSGAYLWYKVAGGGTSSYTFYQDPATSGEYSYFTVIELSGTPTNVAVDGSVAWQSSTSSVSGYTQSYSSAPASSGELALAFFGTGSATSATASSGWTNISGPSNGTDNSAAYFETAGASAPSITISSFSSTQAYIAGMVVFRAAPSTAWSSPTLVDGGDTPESISCPSITSCQEVDNVGDALSWHGSKWSSPASVDGSDSLLGISCPSVNLCWAVGSSGSAVEWNGSAWSSPVTIDGSNAIYAISCPSTSLCWAVDSAGNALSWNGSAWSSPTNIDPNVGLRSVSCPSTSLCWAGDNVGNLLSWNGSAWSSPASSGSNQVVFALSCPSTTLCWAVDGAGDAIRWNGSAWSAPANIDPHPLFAISCPSTTLCWAMDDDGYALQLAMSAALGALSAPSYPTATLTGSDVTLKATASVEVLDSNWTSGWSVWLTTADFTSGSLPALDVAQSTSAPSISCDGGSGTCTPATNSVPYPYTAPEAASAPTATELLDAASGTGIGNQTATFTWTATVPADAYAATYSSTWTYTIEAAP